MIIYIDILFLINVLMDLTIIWTTGIILKEKIRLMRIILGSAIGAFMYIALLYWPPINSFFNFIATIIPICISLIISYSPKNFIELIKQTCISLIISFVLAGIITSIMFFNRLYMLNTNVFADFSYMMLIKVSAITYIIIKVFRKYIRKELVNKKEYLDIKLVLGNMSVEVHALADTGNSLKDNENEIIITEYNAIKEFLPENITYETDCIKMFNMLSDTNLKTKIRMIPFKSLGNPNGMLLGIKIDYAEITNEFNKKIIKNNILIGVCNFKLDSCERFNAITNTDILI